jgi:dATP pyrophosphohydrolase
MARAAFQVLVYPYIEICDHRFEYALLKRSDAIEYWQAISGGGEHDETPLEAARRETYEETGITPNAKFLQLDTIEPIPFAEFSAGYLWGDEVYVIPQYCFGVLVKNKQIVLSYEQAYSLIKYDGDKTALWELHKRLQGWGPRG